MIVLFFVTSENCIITLTVSKPDKVKVKRIGVASFSVTGIYHHYIGMLTMVDYQRQCVCNFSFGATTITLVSKGQAI